MNATLKQARKATAALALAASLGFGAAQAFGAPPAASRTWPEPYCNEYECDERCGPMGGKCQQNGACICVE